MSIVMLSKSAISIESNKIKRPSDWLLHLPDAALLTSILQQLDQRSLSCTAVTCSALRHAVAASMRQLSMRIGHQDHLAASVSMGLWFPRHGSVLPNLTSLSMDFFTRKPQLLPCLPCPQLLQLRLKGMKVQLEPAEGSPGVLGYCSGLTALDLHSCVIEDGDAAFAALAALPELQHLALEVPDSSNAQYLFLLPALQQMTKLTYLNLDSWSIAMFNSEDSAWEVWHELPEQFESHSPLSALVNLQHLSWICPGDAIPFNGLLGGLPSQLVKLTCLDVTYSYHSTAQVQLKHLSSLTALQDVAIKLRCMGTTGDCPGLEHLSQLKRLSLKDVKLDFTDVSTTKSQGWTSRLAALENLSLIDCDVQPSAIAALTQLRALRLAFTAPQGPDLLVALSALQSLTELQVQIPYQSDEQPTAPTEGEAPISPAAAAAAAVAAAAAALTASTNLCSLQLGLQDFWEEANLTWTVFTPGTMYPHLRVIDFAHDIDDDDSYDLTWTGSVPLGEQQLQQLCSCCPALESLAFLTMDAPSPTAFLPLLQLSALTNLGIHTIPKLAEPALIPLTALTALQKLQLSTVYNSDLGYYKPGATLSLRSQACWFNPPDVWLQLLCRLLGDPACRQAVLKRSPAAAAAPAELRLAQLTATSADEQAAGLSD